MEGILTSPLLNLIVERQLADSQDLEAIQGEHNMSGAAIKLLHDQACWTPLLSLNSWLNTGTDVIDITAIDSIQLLS